MNQTETYEKIYFAGPLGIDRTDNVFMHIKAGYGRDEDEGFYFSI